MSDPETTNAAPTRARPEFRANNELALHVADPTAAAEFHARVLGGAVVERSADCIEVTSGALRLFLLRDPAPTHDRVVPSFDVPDRAAALERLRSAGCTFVPIGPHAPEGVYVRDPFGVIFDVVERPASATDPPAAEAGR
jgi:hypothetical protein